MVLELPYALFAADKLPDLQSVKKLVKADKLLLAHLIDASGTRRDVPQEVRAYLVDEAISLRDRVAHLALARCLALPSWDEHGKVAKRLLKTLPHRIVDGKPEFVMSPGSLDSRVYMAVIRAQDASELGKKYQEAKEEKSVPAFLVRRERNAALTYLKAWTIYRYHPELFPAVLARYKKCDEVAFGSVGEPGHLLTLLSSTLFWSSRVPAKGIDLELGRTMAFESKKPIRRANGLYALMGLATDDDIPALRNLARDKSLLQWTGGVRYTPAPL